MSAPTIEEEEAITAKFHERCETIDNDRLKASNAKLADSLQEFVTCVETGVIYNPKGEALKGILRRAKAVLAEEARNAA